MYRFESRRNHGKVEEHHREMAVVLVFTGILRIFIKYGTLV